MGFQDFVNNARTFLGLRGELDPTWTNQQIAANQKKRKDVPEWAVSVDTAPYLRNAPGMPVTTRPQSDPMAAGRQYFDDLHAQAEQTRKRSQQIRSSLVQPTEEMNQEILDYFRTGERPDTWNRPVPETLKAAPAPRADNEGKYTHQPPQVPNLRTGGIAGMMGAPQATVGPSELFSPNLAGYANVGPNTQKKTALTPRAAKKHRTR